MNKSLLVTSIFFLLSFFASAQYQVIKSDADEEVKTNEVKEEKEKVQKESDEIVSGDERRGDKHFYNFAYSTALDYYLDALEKDSTQVLKLKVAECYKMLNDFLKADDWYHKGLTEHGAEVDPKYKLHFAQALSTEQKYDEAKEWFEE